MTPTIDFRSFAESYVLAHPQTNLYLLIDHAGLPGLYRELVRNQIEWENLFDESRESGAKAVAPFLIFMANISTLGARNAFINWVSKTGLLTSSIVVLASPQPISEMKKRLVARLDVQLSGDMDAMLRFYDPRILEQLSKVLSSRQGNAFFCVAERWWFVSRTGQLSEIESSFKIVDEPGSQLLLNQNQESALIEAVEPDRVLYLLLETVPHLVPRLPPNRYMFVKNNVAKASTYNISSTLDYVLYCTAALLYGENFDVQPHWSNTLADVRTGTITLAQAVANSPEIEYE